MADGAEPMDVGAMPLPVRLETGLDRFEGGAGAYAGLREHTADWLRAGGDERFGEEIEGLESLLERSFLMGQPNLAGMGVGAWDLAVATPMEADLERRAARARRMAGRGPLASLFAADHADDEPPEDPEARGRGADLLEAIQRLDAARAELPEDAPETVRDQSTALRVDLFRRLQRERKQDPQLDALLDAVDLDDPAAPVALRGVVSPPSALIAEPAPVRAGRDAAESPYEAALEATLARGERSPEADAETAERVVELRGRIQRDGQQAIAADADSEQGRKLVERVRRLLAEEVALSDGLAVPGGADTAAVRRALAARAGSTPRPRPEGTQTVSPRADLPEVPIWSSRGEAAKVVGYLRVDEALPVIRDRETHVRVPVPGQKRPGWIAREHVADEAPSYPSPLEAPDALPSAKSDAPDGPGGGAGLGRLAKLVADQTGQPVGELLKEAQAPAEPEDVEPAPKKRRARGAAGARRRRAPIRVGQVDIAGLDGPGGADAATVINIALARVPRLLEERLAADRDRPDGTAGRVDLSLPVDLSGDPLSHGRALAGRIADALMGAGAAEIQTLHLGVEISGGRSEIAPRQAILTRLADEDTEGIAELLRAERKELDAGLRGRLSAFFGHGFEDVLVFAGPMSGALARSLSAEAISHGKLLFFDPQHFRPDTAQGEALMAHELAHTRQDDDRDVRVKEAEALRAEAAYLDWIQPGGAPLAEDSPLDPTAPSAAAAGDVAGGVHRAERGRDVEASQGPRADDQKHEDQVKAVLQRVRELVEQDGELEGMRVGDLSRFFSGPF